MRVAILTLSLGILTACARYSDAMNDAGSDLSSEQSEWSTVFVCAGDEAIVAQSSTSPGTFKLTLKNEEAHGYLGLGYRHEPQGQGRAVVGGETFVGFASVLARFGSGNPYRVAHVYPEFGGLKVLIEMEAYQICEYTPNFGDPGGSKDSIAVPHGASCPDRRPHFSYHATHPGSQTKTSKDWFFQNCRSVSP